MNLSIDAVSAQNALVHSLGGTKGAATGGESFRNVLGDAINQASGTEAADAESNALLLSGSGDSLHTAMIDAQKAELALQLTVQIRNKVIDAYNEIMHMQV
jgi:flagellar hook-basal body complex protein FliE